MIGIKLADGSFHPIIEDGGPGSEKITLTTARNGQDQVRIGLYRRPSAGDATPGEFLGELRLSDLPRGVGDGLDIELTISLDEAGILRAFVREPRSGNYTSLRLSPKRQGRIPASSGSAGPLQERDGKSKNIAAAAFAVFGLLLLSALGFMVFKYFSAT